MLLQLQKYDFELRYKRGKDLIITDAFSRAHLNNKQNMFLESEIADHLWLIVSEINFVNIQIGMRNYNY